MLTNTHCILKNQRVLLSRFFSNISGPTTRETLRAKLLEDEKNGIVVGFNPIKVSKGSKKILPKPSWLKSEPPTGENYLKLKVYQNMMIENYLIY